MFIMIPTMLLSGFVFPIESAPLVFQWVSKAIPLTHALVIVQSAYTKGSGFAALWQPFAYLAGFAVVLFTSAVVATHRRLTE